MSYLNTHKHRQSSYLRAYYLRAYKAHSTIVENIRQINLFLQNKPNFPDFSPENDFILLAGQGQFFIYDINSG